MASASPANNANLLLAALSPKERKLFGELSSVVKLAAGSLLIDRGDRTRYVYFPLDCVLSLLATADEQSTVEVAMIGRDGVTGCVEALAGRVAISRILVVRSGLALRISVPRMLKLLDDFAVLREVLSHYLANFIAQIAQTVACTRFHYVESRLARWLLMLTDRSSSEGFSMTQDSLAILLGVRRVGISAAAVAFRSKQLIEYRRGNLRVIDRALLQAEACSCYPADLASYNHIQNFRRAVLK